MDTHHESPEPFLGLQVPERFGVFLWWPEEGHAWIHPEDVRQCDQWIPSDRIFQRHDEDSEYIRLTYGSVSIRIRPTLWLEVKTDGYLIGDRVEVKSSMGKRRPLIATIAEVRWNRHAGAVEYNLQQNNQQLTQVFRASEFQPAFRLGEPLTVRQAELAARARLS